MILAALLAKAGLATGRSRHTLPGMPAPCGAGCAGWSRGPSSPGSTRRAGCMRLARSRDGAGRLSARWHDRALGVALARRAVRRFGPRTPAVSWPSLGFPQPRRIAPRVLVTVPSRDLAHIGAVWTLAPSLASTHATNSRSQAPSPSPVRHWAPAPLLWTTFPVRRSRVVPASWCPSRASVPSTSSVAGNKQRGEADRGVTELTYRAKRQS